VLVEVMGMVPMGIHVEGNQLVDDHGVRLRFRGVSKSGTEFMCSENRGIFDGPTDAASVLALRSWNINVVRIPLNEDCWLGINGVNPLFSGATYQNAIREYVELLGEFGIVAILELHWSAPGDELAMGQQPMPDQHSLTMWRSVAEAYRNNTSVIFDIFNEPYPGHNRNTEEAWSCWLNGGVCAGVPFDSIGSQELVHAIRQAGAGNLILIAGVRYANAMDQWWKYRPTDPIGNIAASWHSYNFNDCVTESCWLRTILALNKLVPVVTTEFGENDCKRWYSDQLMDFLDSFGGSYLGWNWNVWGCTSGPCLISDYNGTATPYGQALYDRLRPTPVESKV